MKKWILSFGALGLLLSSGSARDFSKVEVSNQKIADDLYILQGMGGNILLFCHEKGSLLVDSQFEGLAAKHRGQVASLCSHPVKALINTHWHGDHTGANMFLAPGADLIAHDNVRKRLMTKQFRGDREFPAQPREALPVMTYSERMQLHFSKTVQLQHMKTGHTDGDTVVYLPEQKVVHTGDLFFKDRFPFVDLDSGGSLDGYFKAVQKIIDSVDESWKIVPGHGEVTNKSSMQAWLNKLKKSVEHIRSKKLEKISDGKIMSSGLPSEFESMGTGFISTPRWIDTVLKQI